MSEPGTGGPREPAARDALTPVSYVVLRRGDSVLLQLRRGTGHMDGYWASAAAGHVEAGESAVDAAAREAHEELGIDVADADLYPLTVLHRTQQGGTGAVGRVDFFFTCTTWSGRPRIMEAGKAADLQWFRLDALPEPVVPHERYVLERLHTGLPPIACFGFADPDRADSSIAGHS